MVDNKQFSGMRVIGGDLANFHKDSAQIAELVGKIQIYFEGFKAAMEPPAPAASHS